MFDSLLHLGWVRHAQGEVRQAAEHFAADLRMVRQSEMPLISISDCLDGLAAVALAEGRPERAARWWGTSHALREALGALREPVYEDTHQGRLAAARAALGDEAFAAAWQAGRALSWDEAVAEALGEG